MTRHVYLNGRKCRHWLAMDARHVFKYMTAHSPPPAPPDSILLDECKISPMEVSRQMDAPMMYKPKPGFVFNPMIRYPANAPCPCASGRKWKKCCRRDMPRIVTKGQSEIYDTVVAEFNAHGHSDTYARLVAEHGRAVTVAANSDDVDAT